MQRVTSYILIIGVIIHLFYSSGYLLDYYVNTSFYQENCMNKKRPMLNCDGKCVLAQKIAEAQSQQSSEEFDFTPPLNFEFVLSYQLIEQMEMPIIERNGGQNSVYDNEYSYLHVIDIHIPPQG